MVDGGDTVGVLFPEKTQVRWTALLPTCVDGLQRILLLLNLLIGLKFKWHMQLDTHTQQVLL